MLDGHLVPFSDLPSLYTGESEHQKTLKPLVDGFLSGELEIKTPFTMIRYFSISEILRPRTVIVASDVYLIDIRLLGSKNDIEAPFYVDIFHPIQGDSVGVYCKNVLVKAIEQSRDGISANALIEAQYYQEIVDVLNAENTRIRKEAMRSRFSVVSNNP